MKMVLSYITGRINVFFTLISAAALVLMSSCGSSSHSVPPCEITAEMDSLLATVFPAAKVPGAVVYVIKDGEVKYKRISGISNMRTGEHLTENTLVNISSASKTFAVVGVLKLAKQGLLDLDAPLSTYFPEYNKEVFDKVTLVNVMTHTTGLPDLRPRNDEQWEKYLQKHPEVPFGICSDYIRYSLENELTAFYADVDSLNGEPGEVFFYQDPPFMLISRIIEKVTGETFEDWMQKNVFDAAGLETACYTRGNMERKGVAHGYKPKGHATEPDVFVSADSLWEEFDYGEAPFFLSRVDKGVFITPEEYTKWLSALYSGDVIDLDYLNHANERRTEASWRDIGYNYGTFVTGGTDDKPSKIFHNNGNGGFTIFEAVFPEENVSYFIFSNFAGWNRLELSKKIDGILVEHSWINAII